MKKATLGLMGDSLNRESLIIARANQKRFSCHLTSATMGDVSAVTNCIVSLSIQCETLKRDGGIELLK
jgi:hypothetical protein